MTTNSDFRNNGIDLLRIVSAFYVIILHTLGLGGILSNTEPGTPQYSLFWFIEIWAFCAVNIFVIISGFSGYTNEEKRTDWSKYLILWLQVVFYSVLISVIYRFIQPDRVNGNTIRNMFFPVTNDIYWFFSAYTGLFIIKPFLNAAIRSISEKSLRNLTVIIFLVFCCFSISTDPFRLSKGYSFIWFVILYIIGASLKKCNIAAKTSMLKSAFALICLTMVTLLWKLFGTDIRIMNFNFTRDSLIAYVSPITVTAAAFHVILLSKMRFSPISSKLISFFAPGSFSVYLINAHPCLWLNEFENRFSGWARLKPEAGLIRVIAYAVLFTGASLLIDKLRQFLFKKLDLQKTIYQILYGPERSKALQKIVSPLYGISFLSIWTFLFWKCRIGYGNIDESLYLSVPYRLLKWGDGLLVHEWHEFQLSTFPMLPVTMLYNCFFSGTERIILNFRLIYTFLWGCSALFFYQRTRKISKTGAALASVTYLIYAPYGIMAFSYNSMGILFLLNAGIIVMTAEKNKNIQYSAAGLFLAAAVLCCPYLLILYALLTLITIIELIRTRNHVLKVIWIYISIGALLLFIVFSVFLLSRASIQEIMRSIPIVLNDVEHPDRSLISKTWQYLSSIIHAAPFNPVVLIIFCAACLVGKFNKRSRIWCLSVIFLSVTAELFYYTANRNHINYLMLPVCMSGLFCRLNSNDKRIITIFRCLWLPGMIYTWCINASSNQGLYAITNAAVTAAFASILITVIFLQTEFSFQTKRERILLGIAAVLFVSQITCELSLRYHNVFWEDGVAEQTVSAQTGPEKDILMTQIHLDTYNAMTAELKPLRDDETIKQVLFFVTEPVLYLYTEKGVGSFSTWLPGIDQHSLDRLDLYYQLNPEKIPDAIYIPATNDVYLSHFEDMGYRTSRTSAGNLLLTRENNLSDKKE